MVGCGPICSCGSPFLIWFALFSPHAAATVRAGTRQDPVPNTTCSPSTVLLRVLSPGIAQHQALCLVIPMLGSQSGPSTFNTKTFRDCCSLFRHLLSCSHTISEGSCSYPHQRTASGIHMCRREVARQTCEPGMMKVRAGEERERYFKGRYTKPLHWISRLWGSAEGLQQLLG